MAGKANSCLDCDGDIGFHAAAQLADAAPPEGGTAMKTPPEKGASRPDPDAFGRGIAPGPGVNLLVKDTFVSRRNC